jgi:hypothetical protein
MEQWFVVDSPTSDRFNRIRNGVVGSLRRLLSCSSFQPEAILEPLQEQENALSRLISSYQAASPQQKRHSCTPLSASPRMVE